MLGRLCGDFSSSCAAFAGTGAARFKGVLSVDPVARPTAIPAKGLGRTCHAIVPTTSTATAAMMKVAISRLLIDASLHYVEPRTHRLHAFCLASGLSIGS